jgi:hypothetical protein
VKSTGVSWREEEEGNAAGARVFTDFVRSLEAHAEPEPRRLAVARDVLRAALRGELRRRGLWTAPPGYLGVYGSASWDEALEELLAECYAFIFVDRLRGLQAQLRVKPNIDGLVFLNVRHFLHERQKENDPLGAQVFQVLQSAVRGAVAAGELHVLAGDSRIRNETVLGFSPDADPSAAAGRDLRGPAVRWNDSLLPDLVTLRGRREAEVVERLRGCLPDLRDEGVEAFRFKDLIDPLKADVRARWAALLDHAAGEPALEWGNDRGDDEAARTVRLVRPDTRFEERQLYRRLVDCVLAAVERLDVNDRTRNYLSTLWQFLRVQAVQEQDEGRPSQRRIGDLLGIPRERLPDLYETLGRLLEACRAANSGKPSVTPLRGGFTPDEPKGIAP